MNTIEFLTSLRKADITITIKGEGLQINAPSGAMTESLKIQLKDRKTEIIRFLSQSSLMTKEQSHIPAISRDRPICLSPSQERMWSLAQLRPEDPSYNMHSAFHIEGLLHVHVLEKSLQAIVARHETLRTTFSLENGNPVQMIASETTFPLSQIDLRELDEETRSSDVQRLIYLEARTPFDLTHGPLIRTTLLKTHSHSHIFMVTMHHIISDGWSFSVFFNELTTLYETAISHQEKWLSPLSIQYADFSDWHRNWLGSEKYQADVEFWRKELGDTVVPLILPMDRPRPNPPTTVASSQTLKLPSSIVSELKELGTRHGISHNILFLTAFLVVLFKYSEQEDIIICSPVAGRDREQLQPLIGFFNNIVPIRIQLNNDLSLLKLLKNVRIKTLDVFEHQELPLHDIMRESHVDHIPLTRVLFDFQTNQALSFTLPGTAIEICDVHNGTTNFELNLIVFEKEEGCQCMMEYKTSLFDEPTIEEILTSYESVLKNIAHVPSQKLSAIPLMINNHKKETYLKFHESEQHGRLKSMKHFTSDVQADFPLTTQDEEHQEGLIHSRDSQLPQNSLEAEMMKIWEGLLEYDSIGRHENFFDLGGHSLLAIRLFSKIEKFFGESLPLSTILQAPTIQQLATVLAKGKNICSWNSLVPFHVGGTKPPIFFVHGLGGQVVNFADLSRMLSPDQPFYGLQSLGLDGQTKPFDRIEDMAAHYIQEIETIQPQGPYFLAGACMGGLVAFEMAQRFHSKGQHVAFLGMADTWLANSNSHSSPFNAYKFPNLKILWRGCKHYYAQLREMRLCDGISHTVKQIPAVFEMIRYLDVYRGDNIQKNMAIVKAANYRASQTYHPKPYKGKITYFLASAGQKIGPSDPRLAWKAFTYEGFEIFLISAPNSGQLLVKPYVLELSNHLQSVLEYT